MAYGNTYTFDTPKCERISRSLGIITGQVDFANYSSGAGVAAATLADEVTDYFITTHRVMFDGPTSNGYTPKWNAGTGRADLYMSAASAGAAAATGMIICPRNGQSGGVAHFAAFGLWR